MTSHSPVTPPTPSPSPSPSVEAPAADPAGQRERLELGRLQRLRESLAASGCDAGLFFDPINIRYATATSNMAVYGLHHPCRYALVPTDGPVVLFDFKGCGHLSIGHPAVAEVREATPWYHFVAGDSTDDIARRWAAEIAECAGNGQAIRLAIDRLDPPGLRALDRLGIEVVDGQRVADLARMVKTEEEIVEIEAAVAACEEGIARMAASCRPGIAERELWAILHQANIELGGEWIETRLLTSGPRTNPWYQECSGRRIEDGDLVAFDTDLVGLGGYTVDMSRTWLAGDRPPTDRQRAMYAAANEQIESTIDLLEPGITFRELSARAPLPGAPFHTPVNACVAHGVGFCNEYPLILNRGHPSPYDGLIEPGMVLCVESLVAPEGWPEAVKLEDQVLVTDSGVRRLTRYPHDVRLLG